MAQPQGSSSTAGGRLDGSIGTAAVAADFALGAGWGASTVAVASGSNAQRGQITITCATGGGLAQATATCTFTFPDGAYASAPWVIPFSTNDNSIDTGRWAVTTRSTTSVVLTFSVLPVNAKIYVMNYLIVA